MMLQTAIDLLKDGHELVMILLIERLVVGAVHLKYLFRCGFCGIHGQTSLDY